MDMQTCESEAFHLESYSSDFPNLRILGELAAKCEEFAVGMGEAEFPQTITDVLGPMAQILGDLCHSALKLLRGPEIEEPEPELESEYEAEFEPEPEPDELPDPDEDTGLTEHEFDELDRSEQNAIYWASCDHEWSELVGQRVRKKCL